MWDGRFPMYLLFPWFLMDFSNKISLLMGKGGVQEVILVFLHCELNVWMVTVEIFKKNVRGIGFPFCATVVYISVVERKV